MWPLGSKETLPAERITEIKHKSKSVRKAYLSCIKCNGGQPEPCRGLEVMLLESYAKQCCPDTASSFQQCYNAAFTQEQDPAVCEPHVTAMQKCLKKKGIGYPLD